MNSKKVLYYFLYVLGIVLLIEVVLRVCFPIPDYTNFNRINYQIVDRVDDRNGYLRNIELLWKSSLDTNYAFVHELNKYGFRDKHEWVAKKNQDKKRFFFVGDSFVEGMMSTSEKTIPEGFSKLAEENGLNIEAFNCGMMGIGLNEYLKFLKDAVPIYQPDEVVLVLYSNDLPFQRKYTPEKSLVLEKNNILEPRLLKIIKHIKKGDPIPFAFIPEQSSFYKAVPDAGNPWTFHEATLKKEVTPTIAEAMKKGDFNYFKTNWILEEENFLKAPIDIKESLRFIRDFLFEQGTHLTVFYVPSRSQVTNFYYQFDRKSCLVKCPDFLDLTGEAYQQHAKQIAENCNELGIRFKDFTALIRTKEALGQHLYWNYDDHMKGNSYIMLGREMYNFWKN